MIDAGNILPEDGLAGTLVGRVWTEDAHPGPRPVVLRPAGVFDLSALAPTLSDLFDLPDVAERVAAHAGERLCAVEDAIEASLSGGDFRLLAPCDLQAIKAAGVTFADSLLERVIEERAKGDPAVAAITASTATVMETRLMKGSRRCAACSACSACSCASSAGS